MKVATINFEILEQEVDNKLSRMKQSKQKNAKDNLTIKLNKNMNIK